MALFGTEHLAVLLLTAAVSAAMIRFATGRAPGRVLALVLLAAQIADPFIAAHYGWLNIRNALPIELCDAAAFAVILALWTHRIAVFELAYYWGLTGTVQAMLSPDLPFHFPHPEFIRFFVLHGGIVVGVLYLAAGVRLQPRPHAMGRAFGWTVVYAIGVGLVDWLLEANYMYLRSKPSGASPLDWFGPWPWYILGGAGIGLALFFLASLPYRFGRRVE
ncbi:MAG: TIGR02206 family membrane protein [Planctomycetota bacterium]